jgi:hypothetical protein
MFSSPRQARNILFVLTVPALGGGVTALSPDGEFDADVAGPLDPQAPRPLQM